MCTKLAHYTKVIIVRKTRKREEKRNRNNYESSSYDTILTLFIGPMEYRDILDISKGIAKGKAICTPYYIKSTVTIAPYKILYQDYYIL